MAQSLSVDTSGWDEFWNQWKGVIEKIPGMKQAMLEAVGKQLTENVRRAIDASGKMRTSAVDAAMWRFARILWRFPLVAEGGKC